jgi:peptidoglycan/xylan/chitin deacetylase (PgdA/CDA1 family)
MGQSDVPRKKRWLAKTLDVAGVHGALLRTQSAFAPRGYVRAVNYHGTPALMADSFERQVAFYAEHFSDTTYDDLVDLFREGRWKKPRPGILVTFDDGLRSNRDVALPILERYGLTGWFFVPFAFIDAEPPAQEEFARTHHIQLDQRYGDTRAAMSWDELRAMSARHVVGCHTRTHRRMHADVAPAVVEDEILAARRDMEERLGRPVETYCWVGGEEHSYSAEAARVVRRGGYRFAFMTNNAPITPDTDPLQLQRTNIEAGYPLDVVRFQLSGVMDALYAPKRDRVNRLTAR